MKLPKAKGAKEAYMKHEKSEPKAVKKVEAKEQMDLQEAIRARNGMHQEMFKGLQGKKK